MLLNWLVEQRSPLRELEAVVLPRRLFQQQLGLVPHGPPRRKAEPSASTTASSRFAAAR